MIRVGFGMRFFPIPDFGIEIFKFRLDRIIPEIPIFRGSISTFVLISGFLSPELIQNPWNIQQIANSAFRSKERTAAEVCKSQMFAQLKIFCLQPSTSQVIYILRYFQVHVIRCKVVFVAQFRLKIMVGMRAEFIPRSIHVPKTSSFFIFRNNYASECT